jgi:7-carboxy-7-deazaguanine synthase
MSKIDTNKLLISSAFYSVQGEGISTGVPSYFVRLGLCNLQCGMSAKFMNQLRKDKSLEDGEIFKGDLELEGKATWTCDSTSQWLWRGENKDFQYLIDQWKEQGIYDDIRNGVIHIIWTGGEPTIKGHQEAIVNFFGYWASQEDGYPSLPLKNVFNEIETNGTVYIEKDLFNLIDQINCSPKLENSGQARNKRIVPEAIKRIMEHKNYQMKFVISTEEDIKEIFRDFVEPFNIPLKNVVVMPGMDSQDQFHERTHFILEMAKKYKIRGLSRLHISAYDKTLNV